jgi:hypothetical protein
MSALSIGSRRGGRAVIGRIDLNVHDVEQAPDPKKILRFYDPLWLLAWEHVQLERSLEPLRDALIAGGNEAALSGHYMGLALFRLRAMKEALPLLNQSAASAPSPELKISARILAAAAGWPARAPLPADLNALWAATMQQNDAVLVWEELRAPVLSAREPFATQLDIRMVGLLRALAEKPSGATVGRWGLARLNRNADAETLLSELSAYRDHSNKNKLEWNDPLLLTALTIANFRTNEYAQALETLFEMSKTLPGLRGLQWNLQGLYAARQKAGGEARISQ